MALLGPSPDNSVGSPGSDGRRAGRSPELGRTHETIAYLARNRTFESIPLQQTVRLSLDFSFLYGKAGSAAVCQSLAARFPRVAEPGISIAERDLKSGEHPARKAITGGAVCRVAASAGCGIAEGGWHASREGHAPHRRAARSETPPR